MNKWEKQFRQEIKNKTYAESLKHLGEIEKEILGSWDSVVNKNGRYYLYDYERSHRSKEEYGKEIYGETLNRYLAAKKIQEEVFQNRHKKA